MSIKLDKLKLLKSLGFPFGYPLTVETREAGMGIMYGWEPDGNLWLRQGASQVGGLVIKSWDIFGYGTYEVKGRVVNPEANKLLYVFMLERRMPIEGLLWF